METARAHLADEGIGYLTMQEFNRARWAYDYQARFCAWLRVAGYVRFDEQVDVQISGDGHIGIPATKLAYIEISNIMQELNKWATVEEAAHDKFGASLLIDLGREVQTAVHRWPMEEKPHHINVLRCGSCEQLTLMYRPPRFEGDRIIVNCHCGYTLDEDEFAWFVNNMQRRKDAGETVVDDPGSAEARA